MPQMPGSRSWRPVFAISVFLREQAHKHLVQNPSGFISGAQFGWNLARIFIFCLLTIHRFSTLIGQ